MAPNGDDVTQLTTHLADDRAPDWSPDGQYIAFHSSRDGDYDIYIMDRRGESHYLRKVTDDPEDDWNDYDASWSPDGRQIAFMSERHGNRELYVMNINGSHVRRLTQTERDEKQPAWCPGEDSIAFERRTGRPQVYLMDVNDKSEIALTDSLGRNSSPKWSPDGQRIVFASTRDPENTENAWPEIYVMHRSGAEQTRLTFNSADDDAPAWSPDGEWIVFASKHLDCPGRPDDEDCDWDLFIVRAHGSTPRPLTNSPDLSEYNPVWWGP
jgi:Tol biopolymer transport system component